MLNFKRVISEIQRKKRKKDGNYIRTKVAETGNFNETASNVALV